MKVSTTSPPYTFAVDGAMASAWWCATVPAITGMRILGMVKPRPLPTTDLSSKIAVVTGSNTGVGKRTAFHLAKMKATVVLAVRNMEKGHMAKKELIKELQKHKIMAPDINVMELELCSTGSIKRFVHDFKAKYNRLDILVNNAGQVDPGTTDQGLSSTFMADYLGAYMMTTMLYDTIRNTQGARVINVSSPLHHYGTTKWEDAAMGRRGEPDFMNVLFHCYADSKLAMMLFTNELRRRFAADNCSAVAICVSPGNVNSDIWRTVPIPLLMPMKVVMAAVFLTPDQACHPSVMAAAAPLNELKGFMAKDAEELPLYLQPYWNPLKQAHPFDVFGPYAGTDVSIPSLPPNYEEEGKRLWFVSSELIKAAEEGKTKERPPRF
ncbi:hypothetical protein JKP88DRAFT_252404 [Tribonema minus]|uniref:Uncharacterized protein n=1 Tax=Tribonema minus TaxID=303371 RepID=A0A835ZF30_9STRA|nr:hypothetical protein JKP88DRAFT_252404 [Tribonema minus]